MHFFSHDLAHGLQDFIAAFVTIGVVYGFEIIYIADAEYIRCAIFRKPAMGLGKLLVTETPVT